MRFPGVISVIVTTYNRVDALDLVLQSLATQTDRDFELIVADDGSRPDTGEFVTRFAARSPVPIRHLWQPDQGFRAGQARNLAASLSRGDYLIYLDGDCIVQSDFVARHRALAEPGYTVTGSRILLSEDFSRELCASRQWDEGRFRAGALSGRLKGRMNKCLPLFLKLPDGGWRHYKDFVWRRIKSCNLACWKADAEAIGGFDPAMDGWGHEDADFVFRLHVAGIRRKSGVLATEVLHLWHRMAPREKTEANRLRLEARIKAWRAGQTA